jgi:hypothetical protein
MSAMSQKQQGDQQAATQEMNADISRNEGLQEQAKAKYDTESLSKTRISTLGEQRTGYGAAGVAMEGSPLEVMARTAAEYEKDILLTGFGGDVKADNKVQEAEIYDWMAKSKKDTGWMGAASSAFGGFGSYLRTK